MQENCAGRVASDMVKLQETEDAKHDLSSPEYFLIMYNPGPSFCPAFRQGSTWGATKSGEWTVGGGWGGWVPNPPSKVWAGWF